MSGTKGGADDANGFPKETITDDNGRHIDFKRPNGDKLLNHGP